MRMAEIVRALPEKPSRRVAIQESRRITERPIRKAYEMLRSAVTRLTKAVRPDVLIANILRKVSRNSVTKMPRAVKRMMGSQRPSASSSDPTPIGSPRIMRSTNLEIAKKMMMRRSARVLKRANVP
jgi:hypothetical protein